MSRKPKGPQPTDQDRADHKKAGLEYAEKIGAADAASHLDSDASRFKDAEQQAAYEAGHSQYSSMIESHLAMKSAGLL